MNPRERAHAEEYYHFQRKRKYRNLVKILILFGFLITGSAVTIFFLRDASSKEDLNIVFVTFAVILLVISFSFFILRYLRIGGSVSSSSYSDRELRATIENIRLDILRLKKRDKSEDIESLGTTINDIVNNYVSEEFLRSKITKALSDSAVKESKFTAVKEGIEDLHNRIDDEVERLQRSANVNLLIGILASVFAIGILGYVVFLKKVEYVDTSDFLIQFIPRLSFVIFIELLSFFFLKIYKSILGEIKYFNNEKTNIDFKTISLETAIYYNNEDLVDKIITEFVLTERNFKLGKDESTVEIEKNKLENQENTVLRSLLEKLADKI